MSHDSAARVAKRFKIFEPASIRFGKAIERIHLLDISFGGALAYGKEAPSPGTIFRLQCGDIDCAARVAWRAGPKFGIAFLRPLTPAQLQAVTAYLVTQRPTQEESQLVKSACPPLTARLGARERRQSTSQFVAEQPSPKLI